MLIIKSKNQELKVACQNLVEARKLKSRSEKLERAAKEFISCELSKRGVDIKMIPLNEILAVKVNGEDCVRVTIKFVNRVDLSLLSLKYPTIDQECRKDFPSIYFDPLIQEEEKEKTTLETSPIADLHEQRKILESQLERLRRTIKAVDGVK